MKTYTDYLSEDFLGLGNNKPIKSCFKYGLSSTSKEQFGFFIYHENGYDYEFKTLENKDHSNKHHFCVDNAIFYDYYLSGKVISIFHSHIISSPELSSLDIEVSESLGLPSFVLSCKSKKSFLYYPSSYSSTNLYERIFIPFFQDCITFVKDFYSINLNIKLSSKIKNWARHSLGSNDHLLEEIDKNFNPINFDSIKYGDLIVFKPTMTNLFHVGVMDKNQKYSHHPMGLKPSTELFTKETRNKVYKIYRYKEL